jgi:ABC-type sulfate transport system permease component
MMQRVARIAATVAALFDLAGAFAYFRLGWAHITLERAALVTAVALVPCAIAFAGILVYQMRRPIRGSRGALASMRLPIALPRAYAGLAVLGFIGTLAAMGERFGPYIFLAGITLIALALSQARPRRPVHR